MDEGHARRHDAQCKSADGPATERVFRQIELKREDPGVFIMPVLQFFGLPDYSFEPLRLGFSPCGRDVHRQRELPTNSYSSSEVAARRYVPRICLIQ